ncbi:heavy metal translocating P-type ATPase [Estrella lausannensis]|uniref:Heavy metal translocating P-type ATPase n=1 Tax=Estrella lausannensis TaxID=483423 RepID=A0A0H5DQI9_9BACT|nr:cation-translocating P-type ATPase [Estrella lausannensis]CRX38921.1 heavy metal translocating P-type ATPase [Estrella lausannensis]
MQPKNSGRRERIRFTVQGMRSVRCAEKIEASLLKMQGVKDASVNFTLKRGEIDFEEGTFSFHFFQKEMAETGFEIAFDKSEKNAKWSFPFEQFFYALLTGAPLFVSKGFESVFDQPLLTPAARLILATLMQLMFALPIYLRAIRSFRDGDPYKEFLASLAVFSAYFYSLFLWLTGYASPYYFEVSAGIVISLLLGRWLDKRCLERVSEVAAELADKLPKKTLVKIGNFFEEKDVSFLFPGDIVMIAPGEVIPTDGIVLEGASLVDESALTGEGERALKRSGDHVLGGTMALDGRLIIRSEKVGRDTVAGQLLNMVEKNLDTKAPVQLNVDRFLPYFIPIVLLIAFITLLYGLSAADGRSGALRAIAVLAVASPVAIVYGAPFVFLVASVLGAESGFVFRSAAVVEKTGRLNVVIFDKTGTLTLGEPRVVEIIPLSTLSEKEIISLAASLEMNASHPLSKAVLAKAREMNALRERADNPEFRPGAGLSGEIDACRYFLGSKLFASEAGHSIKEDENAREDKTKIYLFDDKQLLGTLVVEDPIRESSWHSLRQLKLLNIVPVMVTGDSQGVAEAIARRLDITTFFFDVLPQGKQEKVELYQKNGQKVGFVGDGINDSLAIADADVGFAMRSGSFALHESSDVTLFGNDLMSVGQAVDLSRNALSKIRQNHLFAAISTLIFIPLASFGILNPVAASLIMAISPAVVIANSLLLRRYAENIPKSGIRS